MKLRNKKTGEIGWLYCDHISIPKKMTVFSEDKDLSANHWDYSSLAELNAEWEDYEEPKEYWYIDCDGGILCGESDNSSAEKMMISMGNHFGTIKEAEKAVEKLKAWKRLKDKGLKFSLWQRRSDWARLPEVTALKHLVDIVAYTPDITSDIAKDLDLLFGGEE